MLLDQSWIPLRKQLPKRRQLVIVAYYAHFDRQHRVACDVFWFKGRGGWGRCDEMDGGKPTHWMPLPSPPEVAT
jgi:hypothetical protein